MEKLLSIAIPTKNRQEFLLPLLELFLEMDLKDVEIIIQDNSDDEVEIIDFLKNNPCESFKYFHKEGQFSQMENSEYAVSNCTGKYICFLGDDDYVSKYLVEYVRYMDKCGYDCSIFNIAFYLWPDVLYSGFKIPDLKIESFKGKIKEVDVNKEFRKLLSHGGVFLNGVPQLYQAVVLKDRLEQIKKIAGAYFPGPSPDMAVATALCHVIKNMIYCDVPYVSSGQSKKSAAGLGIQHQHKGELGKIKMLPQNIEERWLSQIPRIWTGPTIYAQSANEALRAMGNKKGIKGFNWNYFYAFFYISSREFRYMISEASKNCDGFILWRYKLLIPRAFVDKCIIYLKTRLLSNRNSYKKNGLRTSYEAGRYTDSIIGRINIEKMFRGS